MTIDRRRAKAFLDAIVATDRAGAKALLEAHLDPSATFHVAHPVNTLKGRTAILEGLYLPLHSAFSFRQRRDEILLAGSSRTGSGTWIAAMGHYVGNFVQPFLGIAPSGHLAFLRYGEFYRIADGRITEARILVDLVDLMRQAGHAALPLELGTEMLFPSPATHDGVMLESGDSERGERSAALVEAMLADLGGYDPETFDSPNQTGTDGYWHQDMLWYGPAGIGSSLSWNGFKQDHRIPFIRAFPDRVGGNHYARFGDGNYVASGGWPSLTATHRHAYLGVAPTDKKIGMRVMDFWRCAQGPDGRGKIMENWVLIDMIDLFLQMGVDLLRSKELPGPLSGP